MKERLIMILSFCLITKISTGQILSQENIDQVCKAFVSLTDTALKQKQFEKVVIYSNAFKSMAQQYKTESKYSKYFEDVDLNNFKITGEWTIGLRTVPKKPGKGGGFVNVESLSSLQIKTLEEDIKKVKEKRGIE